MSTVSRLNPKGFATTPEIDQNLLKLADVIEQVESAYGKTLAFTNGLRDTKDHLRIYAEKNAKLRAQGLPEIKVPMGSNHLKGLAVDVADATGNFWKWCMANLELMEKLGVYFEDRSATPTWVHMQIAPPASGRRIFKP
jgi:hypothetical protein